jgi:hypothetical protein
MPLAANPAIEWSLSKVANSDVTTMNKVTRPPSQSAQVITSNVGRIFRKSLPTKNIEC